VSTLSALFAEIQSGQSTSADLVKQSLECAAQNESGKSLISVLNEEATARAAQLDAGRSAGTSKGLLDGLPVVIKDNICKKDTLTTCGSKILEKFVSPYDATVVERLEAEGAVIIGKANMDEFAMGSSSETSYFGATLNPQDSSLVPGGSSGGSAAAVAAGIVPVALGSDTGGSIRQPAACCGVVGLKPTYGRVSRYGLVAFASSLDQIGPIATNVEDCGRVLNVIAGRDPKDSTSSPQPTDDFTADLQKDIKGKIIGVPKEYFGEGLDAGCRQALEASLDQLKAEGAILKEISLPSMEYAISAYYIIATAEASSNLSRFDGVRYTYRSPEAKTLEEMFTLSRAQGFGPEVKRRILMGAYVLSSGYYDAYYVRAQKVRRVISDDFSKAFENCDVIAAPTMPGKPLKPGQGLEDPMAMYLSDIYTVSLNLAGLPGISVPCGTSDGLKVGMQLVGKAFAEKELLQVASAVERNFVS